MKQFVNTSFQNEKLIIIQFVRNPNNLIECVKEQHIPCSL